MLVIQSITRKLSAVDFERIYFYCHRIKLFHQYYSYAADFEDQVLAIIWSRKPSPGPLLCNVSEAELEGDSFDGLAIHARLIIGPCIRKIQLRVCGYSFTWSNIIAMLKKAAPLDLSSFVVGGAYNLPCLESESLELLSTFRSVRTLAIAEIFFTSHAITMIGTLPALEDLRLSITEQQIQHYNPPDGNNFPLLTHLEICSDTMNACRLLLMKIQSRTLQSLKVGRTGVVHWDVRGLFVALHACNLVSRLESLELYNFRPHSFVIDARTFEGLDSFKHLRKLSISPTSVDLDDSHLMQLAKALPHLRLLNLNAEYTEIVPQCTFTGLQNLIQFCPKLESLTLRIDARQIPIFSTQPDGEYPLGLHLTTLDLCAAPVSNACDVASYLIMLFPALTKFSTDYDYFEEGDDDVVNRYCTIWSEVHELFKHVI